MIRKWFISLWVFPVWVIGFALAWVVVFLGHELSMVFAAKTLRCDEYTLPLVHISYYLVAGLVTMGFFIASLEYLKRSARKDMLLGGSLTLIGGILIAIALVQAGLTLYEYLPADLVGILLMAVEGLAGACMLLAARLRAAGSRAAAVPGE
jgi:carbon starvation protein CstA